MSWPKAGCVPRGRSAAIARSAEQSLMARALRQPSFPGGRVPRRHSAPVATSRSTPRIRSLSRRSPTCHSCSASISTGMASSIGSTSHGQRVVELAEEPLHRVLEEVEQVVQRHVVVRRFRQRPGQERAWRRPVTGCGAGRAQGNRVEGKRLAGDECAAFDVANVERLQRVFGDDLLADRLWCGGVERVEQLQQRNRRGPVMPGVLVGAGVGDDERLGGRADGVEQQLAVLGADVALTGQRFTGQGVVTVDGLKAGEHAVVESDQTHHPVRNGPHRHHGADGERPGAEVGAGGPAREVAGQHRADIGEPHLRVRTGSRLGQNL